MPDSGVLFEACVLKILGVWGARNGLGFTSHLMKGRRLKSVITQPCSSSGMHTIQEILVQIWQKLLMQKESVDRVSEGGEGPEVHSLTSWLFSRSVFFFFSGSLGMLQVHRSHLSSNAFFKPRCPCTDPKNSWPL